MFFQPAQSRSVSTRLASFGVVVGGHVLVLAGLLATHAIRMDRPPQALPVRVMPAVVPHMQASVTPPKPMAVSAQALETVTLPHFQVVQDAPPAPPPAVPNAIHPVQPPAAPAAPEAPPTPPHADASRIGNLIPEYPEVSRRLDEEGCVRLSLHVLEDGSLGDLQLQESSGYRRLDEAAIRAVQHWRFVPAQEKGHAVAAWYVQPLSFSLGKPKC